MESIVLFDGECNFCDKSVQFIIKRDPQGKFKFASLQSTIGQDILNKFGLRNTIINSLVLIENDQYYIKSTAALRICKSLKGPWKLASILILVPRPIRDYFYSIIAKNRYKWFGKKDLCLLPSKEIRDRFL
ncbi:hypothetical protein MTP04_13700 [Lysinibacillus sp. PLM2]|nr:hypothetical protein MTP04_13700 [Lysinibacillus sp. PLM2]